MYVNSWIKLISISESRRTNNKAKGRVRLSLKKEGISGRTAITITDPGGILLGNLGLQLLRWLTRCSENQDIKSWRKLRISHTSNDKTRLEKTKGKEVVE